ncbi:hypothetical protein IFM89_036053 [Coptis chinensis]|uniref:Uncharacterized protein n=1 Tax=Coptis chinensis TaxID=261450 RepID=A0A835H9S8_9MAGN|nr:hypothetical protein IFM89_036053 [Coptis chinensis]
MPSDKEIVEMIDINLDDATSVNLLLSTISYADNKFDGFYKAGNTLEIVKKSILNDRISNTKFPPKVTGFTLESAGDCLVQYLFPTLSRCKPKAFFLGHMVKCLLQSCSGQQKLENRDDFRNKRLDLAAELLDRELQNRIRHTERRMVKAIQRDLYGERSTQKMPGMAVALKRTNPQQMMCEMRNTPFSTGEAVFPLYAGWRKVWACKEFGSHWTCLHKLKGAFARQIMRMWNGEIDRWSYYYVVERKGKKSF